MGHFDERWDAGREFWESCCGQSWKQEKGMRKGANGRERERRKEKGIQPTSGGQRANAQEIKLMSWNRDSDHTNMHRTHSHNKIMLFMYEQLHVKSVKPPFYALTHISYTHTWTRSTLSVHCICEANGKQTVCECVLRTNFPIQLNLEKPEEIQSSTGQRSRQCKWITTHITYG